MNLTLFSTAKPFNGQVATHQTNAMTSWTQIKPRPEIMLYGNELGVGAIAKQLGAIHHDNVVMLDGVPLLDSLFSQALGHASHDYLVYVNADVMVIDGLAEAVQQVVELFPDGFLGVCRRWDIRLDEPLDFSQDWRGLVRDRVADHGTLHSDCSSDIFVFPRPLWELAPFSVGRPGWDNWMFFKATDVGWPVVDLTAVVMTAHPEHNHGPDGQMGVRNFWRTDHLAKRNGLLVGGEQYCFRHVQRAGYLWDIMSDGVVRKL